MNTSPRYLIAALILICPATVVISRAEAIQPASEATQPIPWSEVGAKAGVQYQGDGLDVTAISQDEATLRCVFQKLEGKAARDGLWITSTAEAGQKERFRIMARAVGRLDQPPVLLANEGKVVTRGSTVSLSRPGLIEEYSSSMDGLRQDFLVFRRPEGVGALSVELAITGATATTMSGGAELRLPITGRKIAYTRLNVTDDRGQVLSAHMEVTESTKLRVVVEDANAVYPVRIDPTFSDADWGSMGTRDAFEGASAFANRIRAMAVTDEFLYVGGDFESVAGVYAHNVARWDGNLWSTLGAGAASGVNGFVLALAAEGNKVYVGGTFTAAGGQPANGIARWDGTAWSNMGGGFGVSQVECLAMVGASVCAGGQTSVASWDGNSWTSLGTLPGSKVEVLAVMGGSLYAGGSFTGGISRWTGASWVTVGSGVTGSVQSMAVSGNNLYVGGNITKAGGIDARGVAVWNGSGWSALGQGVEADVAALAIYGSHLYAGGDFTSAGGSPISNLARWNGTTWTAVGSGVGQEIFAMAIYDSKLIIGGGFPSAGGINLDSIASWDGTAYEALDSSPNGTVTALALHGSDVYAAGNFITASGKAARRVAQWNGSFWAPIGEGFNAQVHALAYFNGSLYAGGRFTLSGTSSVSYIARWDGSQWRPLGTGVNDFVYALAVSGTNLYVGGQFNNAGAVAVNKIAQWNGNTWTALGSGVNSDVLALAVTGSTLYVGGNFTQAGGKSVNRIAKWSGAAWSALGAGVDARVRAISASPAALYIGGDFTMSGTTQLSRIAKWNGTAWEALGAGLDNRVRALALNGGILFAGGEFLTAGGINVRHIAKWNGAEWSSLGSGIGLHQVVTSPSVEALIISGSSLYVGGFFDMAGTVVASNVARATISTAPDISLEEPEENFLQHQDTKSFGQIVVGGAANLTFTLGNFGTELLTDISLSLDGPGQNQFSITSSPASSIAGPSGRSTFSIRFSPTSTGFKTATLHIVSNDPDENPFDLTLTGTGAAPLPPAVKTLPATAITHNSATLNGLVNAKGSTRAVAFDYGLTTAYGASVNAVPASVDGSADTPVSVGITGLLPHTKYNFRVRAAGAQGAANGTNMTFTTLNRAPTATGETVLALPSAKVTIPVLSNDADPDGDALSIATISPLAASVGTVAKAGTDLVFTPSATFTGGSFTYTASDALGLKSNVATVTLQLAACTLGADVAIPADSLPYDLSVSATAPWTVIESLSWMSFVPPAPGATSVRFIPVPNPSKDSRTGTVKIGGKTHTVTQNGILLAPVLTTPSTIPNAAVSANYDLIIPTLNGPVTYNTTGMPKGLALSNITGRITGYPTEAKTTTVTVKAKNVWGDSNTISFGITVVPFPPALVGSYSASIADSETLTDKLGGLMTMTVTNTGGVTGTLKLGAGSHSFTGRLNTAVNPLEPDPDHAVLKTSVIRTGKPAVALTVNMNSTSTDLITGDVTLPGAVPAIAVLSGSKHVWHATTKPANQFKGYFTAALEPTDRSASIPQGDGFLTFSVSAAGAVSWSGQLADGTVIATQSATLLANGELPLYALLYSNKGSLNQRLSITSGTKIVSGSPKWHKKPQTTRSYAAGFDPTTLNAIGAEYLPPGGGKTLLNIAAPGSASIDFMDGGIGSVSQFSDLDQVFNISATHAATFTGVNPAHVKLTKLDVVKGTFSGSLTLKDTNPFNAALPQVIRPMNFSGVLLRTSGKGTGYFVLPGISGPPANVNTSLMTSGQVRIVP